ncbi:unnamed protein product [Camellia sinensis]
MILLESQNPRDDPPVITKSESASRLSEKYMSCKGACLASIGADQPAEVVDDAPKDLTGKYILRLVPEHRPTMLKVYQTMRATGEKHGLVDDSEMWKETEIATASASASKGDVEIIG